MYFLGHYRQVRTQLRNTGTVEIPSQRASSTPPEQQNRIPQNQPNLNGMDQEMERLKRQLKSLQEQLLLADDTIHRLKKREKELTDKYDFHLFNVASYIHACENRVR